MENGKNTFISTVLWGSFDNADYKNLYVGNDFSKALKAFEDFTCPSGYQNWSKNIEVWLDEEKVGIINIKE